MTKLTGWVFAWSILGLVMATGHAADKLVPEDGAVEVMLLRQKSVREDLKLTHNEADKINKHCAQQWKKAKEINTLSESERDAKFEELTRENDRFIEVTITKEQRKRLKEIELQIVGLMCVTRPDISKKLNLTDDQKKRAVGMQKLARQEMQEVIYASKPDTKNEKMAELRKTSRDKLFELLTDEQETMWLKMVGLPFKGDLEFHHETASK